MADNLKVALELENRVGETLGVSSWLRLDQARIDAFAAVTLDEQWIHTDAQRAAAGPFGATIVHGYLTLSLLSYFTSDLKLFSPGITLINYGLDKVRFLSPVVAGSRVRDHVRLLATERRSDASVLLKTEHTVELEAAEKPALVAEMLLLVPDSNNSQPTQGALN